MAEKTMMLEIISPDCIFYKGEVSLLEMTTTEGETGIYPGHIPMTNILAPGTISIHEKNDVKRAVVHAGFSRILPDKVTILAETAAWDG